MIGRNGRWFLLARQIPATLILAALITILQIGRLSGGSGDAFVNANLNVVSWELLYSQPWRLLTSTFLHQNLPHFLINLFFLLYFGSRIERSHGWAVMLAIFCGGLVSGYILEITIMHSFIIGISGGICGLFGFSLVANRRRPWWTTLTKQPSHALYAAGLLLFVFVDWADWVPYPGAHLNHLVGILYGLAFGGAFLLAPPSRRWPKAAVMALPLLLFASLLYSPWQVEWRLLQSADELTQDVAACRLASVKQESLIAAELNFVNDSAAPVVVYWLDYEGQAHFQIWLRAGGTKEHYSFVGHSWCIVDAEGQQALQTFVVNEVQHTITIR